MMIRAAVSGMIVAGLPAAVLLILNIHHGKDLASRVEYYENMYSESFYVNVYVLNSDVAAGELINESLLSKRTVSSSDDIRICATELSEITGMRAKIALPAGSVLNKDLVYDGPEISDDERILDLNNIILPYNLKEGDIVDIRISFPNGEDFVVAKHKTVQSVITEADVATGFSVSACEQEILRLSSAGVDTEKYSDTVIYGVRYLGDFQKPSTEYYPVNPEVFDLLAWDPNITELFTVDAESARRLKLEDNLKEFLSDGYLLTETYEKDGAAGEDRDEDPASLAESFFSENQIYRED